jgi:hypothetical protein
MANADEYERVISKAEGMGLGSLDAQEMQLMKVLYKESGSRGNRARRVINGK